MELMEQAEFLHKAEIRDHILGRGTVRAAHACREAHPSVARRQGPGEHALDISLHSLRALRGAGDGIAKEGADARSAHRVDRGSPHGRASEPRDSSRRWW